MQPKSLIDISIPSLRPFVGQEPLNEGQGYCSVRYKRQINTGSPAQIPQPEPEDLAEDKRTREVHFAFAPKKYARLKENGSQQKSREEKKLKRKKKYKKLKKNVGRVLRYSWKCVMLGLQNLTVGYSIPLSAAATLYPEFQTGRTNS